MRINGRKRRVRAGWRSNLIPHVLSFAMALAAVVASADEPRPPASASAEATAMSRADLAALAGRVVTEIKLAGNHVTKDWVIAREIWTEVGEPLDPDLVRDDMTRLENLAIFGSVIVTGREQDGGVALDFAFTEMPWIIPFPALGYTEENGFSVGLGMASPNFLGRNITLAASARFGGASTYSVSGRNPWITGNHVSAGGEAWHQARRNKLLDFRQTSDMVQLDVGKYLGRNGRLRIQGGFYGVGSDRPGVTLSGRDYDNLWHGGFTIGLDSRDSWRVPHQGWHNELGLMYMGGDADSWTLDVDIRRYQPLAPRHTLATGPLLSFQSGEVGVDVPAYMQFFLGGANSVRGYELEELGKEMFGRSQLLYTLEYRYLLVPIRAVRIFKWSFGLGLEAAAFWDVGVAWSRRGDLNLERTRNGYGAGLRLLVPSLECVRFDIGVSQYGDVVFNFGIESIFAARRERVR